MNRILITGATGFLGKQMAKRLADEGNIVHALYRSEKKIRDRGHENIRFFKGTLGDRESIARAMKDCSYVYHMAAFAAAWAPKPRIFYQENVMGTENVLESALKQGIKRVVYTSTAGILGPSNGKINTEEKQFSGDQFTPYDQSKAMAEEKVMQYVRDGLDAVILNPTRIFGPGNLSKSNALTMMCGKYLEGKWRIIPGDGKSIGNYVYVTDVVDCHLLAMEKGKSGERYLVGGENLSFNEIFAILREISGVNHRLYKIPTGAMLLIASVLLGFANITGYAPLITPSFVRRYNHDWVVSSDKAKKELGYSPISFTDGLKKTIQWIQDGSIH